MCGRAAQTVHASNIAAGSLGMKIRTDIQHGAATTDVSHEPKYQELHGNSFSKRNNYNLSPGMDAAVIWMEHGELKMDRKVWGLVTKGGSTQNPLPSDAKTRMGMHFSGLMYNARTDTLFEKPTFSKLAFQKKSCVVALDGYFEWKASPLAGGKGKKQPYFVHPKPSPNGNEEKLAGLDPGYLLMAGLWTSVPTGLSDEPYLDTFTILTTEACKQIEWLHHRMPVCLWDLELARKWLQDPSPSVHKAIDGAAKSYNEGFAWYMVTTDMSSVKFRGIEAIKEKKPPKPVTAFFSKMADTKSTPPKASSMSSLANMTGISSPLKRQAEPLASSGGATPNKKVKKNTSVGSDSKGSITSFFQKKN